MSKFIAGDIVKYEDVTFRIEELTDEGYVVKPIDEPTHLAVLIIYDHEADMHGVLQDVTRFIQE